jgi:hypothetical protein
MREAYVIREALTKSLRRQIVDLDYRLRPLSEREKARLKKLKERVGR